MKLNQRARQIVDRLARQTDELQIQFQTMPCGAQVLDFGQQVSGSAEAGCHLAEICLAGLGKVCLGSAEALANTHFTSDPIGTTRVLVETDQPLAACLGSQYAGWPIRIEDFFAMGSGPMRALRGREAVLTDLDLIQQDDVAVGVLETSQMPDDAICQEIARQCGVRPDLLALLVVRTASVAGTIQVVARSVETALHKLHELSFDLTQVVAGAGAAPLPPIAADDLTAIGWTNDAVLYAGQVVLWVEAEDSVIESMGPQVPSQSSSEFGRPFAQVLQQHDQDFYKIDPMLFGPAIITFVNRTTGRAFSFGQLRHDIFERSIQ